MVGPRLALGKQGTRYGCRGGCTACPVAEADRLAARGGAARTPGVATWLLCLSHGLTSGRSPWWWAPANRGGSRVPACRGGCTACPGAEVGRLAARGVVMTLGITTWLLCPLCGLTSGRSSWCTGLPSSVVVARRISCCRSRSPSCPRGRPGLPGVAMWLLGQPRRLTSGRSSWWWARLENACIRKIRPLLEEVEVVAFPGTAWAEP